MDADYQKTQVGFVVRREGGEKMEKRAPETA